MKNTYLHPIYKPKPQPIDTSARVWVPSPDDYAALAALIEAANKKSTQH